MITASQQAGHALRVKGPALAEAVVDEQYRLQPDLAERYGPDARQHCVRDVAHHVRFLAASVETGDPHRFVNYVRWARDVMAAHDIAPSDFLTSLQILRRAVAALHTPPGFADAVCPHIDAALLDVFPK